MSKKLNVDLLAIDLYIFIII